MSADVLSVMETAGARIRNTEPLVANDEQREHCRRIAGEVAEAREAVYELIAAASEFGIGIALSDDEGLITHSEPFVRLSAALRRVRGES